MNHTTALAHPNAHGLKAINALGVRMSVRVLRSRGLTRRRDDVLICIVTLTLTDGTKLPLPLLFFRPPAIYDTYSARPTA
jgi:hypothetical protein